MSTYSRMRARQRQHRTRRRFVCQCVRVEEPGRGPKLRNFDEIHVASTGECRRWVEVRG